VALLAIPIIANALALFGVVDADAQILYSGLQHSVVPGFLVGLPYIDPSGAYVYEPQGREALRQWLAGEIPWWNHYESVGIPLAGSMISGVFSPYLPLLALPNGVILQQVIGQLLCGLLTYKALRLVGCSRFAAFLGGALFELNGTFAWLGSIWSMPMVALPLWICGLEFIRRGSRRDTLVGLGCVIAATYIAIVSSFIEIGFLSGLFVIAWFAARLVGLKVRAAIRFTVSSIVGGVFGVMLGSPLLVAFADALKYGFSIHQAGDIGHRAIIAEGVPQFFLPYVWGNIFHYHVVSVFQVWGSIGGYAGIGSLVVASAALSARRSRPLVAMLTAWIILTVGAEFGVPYLSALFNAIPGVAYTAQFRYSPPTWEFALAVLCGLLITEWGEDPRLFLRPAHRIVLATLAVILTGYMYLTTPTFEQLLTIARYNYWLVFSIVTGVSVAGIVLVCMSRFSRSARALLGAVLVGEALLYYVLPTLSYPRSGAIDTGFVTAFHRSAGYARLYSMNALNALQPDYGAYYQIPQIDFNDSIIPKLWEDYIPELDPYDIEPLYFLPYRHISAPNAPTLAEMFAWNRQRFAALAVKYVDADPDDVLPSYSPQLQAGRVAFVLGGRSIAGSFGGVPPGDHVRSVRIALRGGDVDGNLRVRLCSGVDCEAGSAPIPSSDEQDVGVDVSLARPLLVRNARLSFVIVQDRFHHPAAVWLNASGSDDEVTIGQPGLFPNMRLRTTLMPFTIPTGAAGDRVLRLGDRVLSATLPTPKVAGTIVSVAVLQSNRSGTGDGTIRIRLCSGSDCALGERSAADSGSDGYLQIPLTHPLRIRSPFVSTVLSQSSFRRPYTVQLSAGAAAFSEALLYMGRPVPGWAANIRFAVAMDLPVEVYHGVNTSLFELPAPAPYFEAGACVLRPSSRDQITTICRAPATLVRRELFHPGWTATVNGADVKIGLGNGIFDAIELPPGESTVRFHYEPRYGRLSVSLAGLALLVMCACFVVGLRSPGRSKEVAMI
jgi:hypothetical protein